MRSLFDVNVLVALLDSAHVHHQPARNWLETNISEGWASCPITQNGCIRILSSPTYPGHEPPGQIAARLSSAINTQWHEFWPDSASLLDSQWVNWSHVLGTRQVTDVYLLALARHHGGRLVTLDRSVPLAAVPGAGEEHLVRI
jgi:toxin-antitoxin system PIN domain toxin